MFLRFCPSLRFGGR